MKKDKVGGDWKMVQKRRRKAEEEGQLGDR